ncbi:GalNAc-alpha-(1-_4)-GalNAc-alpha-(1-_3)-diNAcBac-PP-undecaprenol alpha-1,4-N-acetyl-D-galactosaminyltransferase [Parabacteroides sp. PFB2-10]|uniref:glycosyltransferase family 4 protein n=1 Tax=Parabacteroides sp. PFB2-10 TaxID=1742405 RepID=UPI0024767F2C|nr:glycosyltransferase family 4 protein [Parabacteroides sp. PFB2-10]MDH6312736.1 GalNAc-alpha-(1->4)-GalNAc-alpha-(1->3)-diNAcBac-PP-undecaprenol alpha-1,4-N-acetyl-D-galactosaminyltransferase [Parabacteroides sp. PFB2-10]
MKLLFYISSMRGGGAERVMSILCNELIKRNHEVTLATNLSFPIAYKLDDRVKLVNLSPDKKRNRLLRKYNYMRDIHKIAKKNNPDIIISFMWQLNALVLLSTLGLSIPVIVSEHTNFIGKKMSFCQKMSRLHINKLTNFTTVLTKSDVLFLKNKLTNVILMPNPLSFPIYKKNNMLQRKKIIIAIGSLDRYFHKGFDNLIKIWSELAYKYPEWELEIYGSGDTQRLDMLIGEYQLFESVKLKGFCQNLDEVMRQSSIFVLSSRYEGLPMVLIEAMSQGCACISFDCNTGPRDIIENRISGLLIEDQNMAEMKNGLEQLIVDSTLRESLSLRAVKGVTMFNVDNIVNKWEGLFQSLKRDNK